MCRAESRDGLRRGKLFTKPYDDHKKLASSDFVFTVSGPKAYTRSTNLDGEKTIFVFRRISSKNLSARGFSEFLPFNSYLWECILESFFFVKAGFSCHDSDENNKQKQAGCLSERKKAGYILCSTFSCEK